MEFYPFEPNWKTLTFFSRVRKTLQCKNDDSFVPTFFAAVSQTSLALLGNLCTVKTVICKFKYGSKEFFDRKTFSSKHNYC